MGMENASTAWVINMIGNMTRSYHGYISQEDGIILGSQASINVKVWLAKPNCLQAVLEAFFPRGDSLMLIIPCTPMN
jgi:hypothetical protein